MTGFAVVATRAAADGRRDRAHEISDVCHNLPGLLTPERRRRLVDGLRYNWRTSDSHGRHWLRSRWDHLGYDHRWLTEASAETSAAVGDHAPSSDG